MSSRISVHKEEDFENTTSRFTPLSAVADAFEELSAVVKAKGFDYDLDLKTFCDACSLVSVLFGCLGKAFKFAELEYCSKVRMILFSKFLPIIGPKLVFDLQA